MERLDRVSARTGNRAALDTRLRGLGRLRCGASIGLAADLSKPLFWLGASPLRNRIAAWTLGRAWRGGVLLGLAPAAAGIVIGAPVLAALSVPVATVAYWWAWVASVRAVAVAVPDDLDKLMDTVTGSEEWTASAPAHSSRVMTPSP